MPAKKGTIRKRKNLGGWGVPRYLHSTFWPLHLKKAMVPKVGTFQGAPAGSPVPKGP